MAALLWVSACVEIGGGAAELSWTLRDFDGSDTRCENADVGGVRLCWVSLGDGGLASPRCLADASTVFLCSNGSGATGFELAEGPTALFIEPVCVSGLTASRAHYRVPPAIVRDIVVGQVATLDSLLIEVYADDASSPCPATGCTCRDG